jgi:hypothetical protein
MRAKEGDRLVLPGRPGRGGVVVGVLGKDGAPPYVIKWHRDGTIAMVFPDGYARIVPAGHPAGTDREPSPDQ